VTLYHSDTQMCRQCGGLCCQGHAGVWVDPRRFLRIFCTGDAFDPGHLPEGVVLRDLGGVLVPAPQTVASGCIFLEERGCRLAAELRPCQCLALQPVLETLIDGEIHCTLPPEGGSQTARQNWRQFWKNDQERGDTSRNDA